MWMSTRWISIFICSFAGIWSKSFNITSSVYTEAFAKWERKLVWHRGEGELAYMNSARGNVKNWAAISIKWDYQTIARVIIIVLSLRLKSVVMSVLHRLALFNQKRIAVKYVRTFASSERKTSCSFNLGVNSSQKADMADQTGNPSYLCSRCLSSSTADISSRVKRVSIEGNIGEINTNHNLKLFLNYYCLKY